MNFIYFTNNVKLDLGEAKYNDVTYSDGSPLSYWENGGELGLAHVTHPLHNPTISNVESVFWE